MSLIYFVCAIFFICLAHIVRIIRWELFIAVYEKPDRKDLIQAMSFGYILNYFLPLKLGEFVRAWCSGRKMKNGKTLGLSTVIVDRYLDIVFVGIIFLILYFGGGSTFGRTALMYVATSVILLVFAFLVYEMRNGVKKVVRAMAGIFNEQIESEILKFAWALIWNFKDIFQKINKIQLVVTTFCMWLGYLLSYYLFALFLQIQGGLKTTWVDIFLMLFTQNGIKGSTGAITLRTNDIAVVHPVFMIIYMVFPTIILLVLSLLLKRGQKGITVEEDNYLRLFPHMDAKERLDFLENYFSGKNRNYIQNYLKINQGISIIRDYSAGSNATTMLCMDGTGTFFRKYVFGEDREKLFQQICWIDENRDTLALPEILRRERTDVYCYYDMPYNSGAVGLFEYAHSMPLEQSWKIIMAVLESMEETIYKKDKRNSDKNTIYKYIELKVQKNLEMIKSSKRIKKLQQYETIFINGVEYKNIQYYEKYLTKEYLYKIFKDDAYSVIHGDLTVENIICIRDDKGNDDFYIIDPNTGNVHDSPNLDYAKLLQSIHGGYEFLMSTREVKAADNHINFMFSRSSVYKELHELFRAYMLDKLGEERTKAIYFHEIIHWLRLMPYKVEKDGKRALLFYAGMLLVMNDVIIMYGDN